MKSLCLLTIFIPLLFSGCAVVQNVPTQQPMALEDIKFSDLQMAASKSINKLLTADVLSEKENSKPFVMVGKIDGKLIPHIKTDIISQDIRLNILMSDKAITMPESAQEEKSDKAKEAKNQIHDALPTFNYYLSGEVKKEKWPNPESDQECYSLHFKLKDLKTKLVIWEEDVKLLQ